jgi:hypothetical protein
MIVEVFGDAVGLIIAQVDDHQFSDLRLVLQVLLAEEVDAIDDGRVVLRRHYAPASCAAHGDRHQGAHPLQSWSLARTIPIEPVASRTLQVEVRLAIQLRDGNRRGYQQSLPSAARRGCGAVLQFGYSLRLAGTAQGQKPDLGLGPHAGGIRADEGQGAIVGTDRRRGIAAVPESQLLRLRVGIIEVDAPQKGTVFVSRFAFGIGGRIGVYAMHAVDCERSVGSNGNAGDVANFEDIGAGNWMLTGCACQHGKYRQTQKCKKSPHEGD